MKGRPQAVGAVVCTALALALVLVLTGAALAQGERVEVGRDILIPEGTKSSKAVAFGASVRVEGSLEGSAVAIGGDVYVSGSVMRDVVAVGGTVVLAPGAVVHGDAVAIGGGVQRAEEARVEGRITSVSLPGLAGLYDLKWLPGWHIWPGSMGPFGPWFWWWGRQFTGFLSGLVLGAVILALWPANVEHMVRALPDHWGRFALVGFLGYLVSVPLIVLIGITIIGLPLALLLLLALVAARFLAYTVVSLFVGRRLLERLSPHAVTPFAELLFGVAVLFLVRSVPLVGWLVGPAVAVIGLGAVLDTRAGSGRP